MKLKVLKRFHDKVTGVLYKVGSEIEVSDKRGAEILAAPGNLAVKVEGSKDEGSNGNKPHGNKPHGNKPHGNKPNGNKPQDEKPEGEGSKNENKNE